MITFRNRTNGPQEIRKTNGENIIVPAMGEIGPFNEADFPAETMILIRACQVVEVIPATAKKSTPAATVSAPAAVLPGMTATAQVMPGMPAPAAVLPGMTAQEPRKAGRPKKTAPTEKKGRGRPRKGS